MRKVKYMTVAVAVVAVVAAGAGVWGLLKAKQAQSEEAALEKKIFVTKSSGNVTAPNFQLTDQHGKTVSLAEQQGKVVLLQFLEVVERAGTAFAFPTSTVHVASLPSESGTIAAAATAEQVPV